MSRTERNNEIKAFLSPTSVVEDDTAHGHRHWKRGEEDLPNFPHLHQEEPGQTQWVSLPPLTAVTSLLDEYAGEEEDEETRVAFSFDEKETLRSGGRGANPIKYHPVYQPEFSLNPKILQHQQADFERRRVEGWNFNARAYTLENEEAMSFKAMRQLQEDMRDMEVSDATKDRRNEMVDQAMHITNVSRTTM